MAIYNNYVTNNFAFGRHLWLTLDSSIISSRFIHIIYSESGKMGVPAQQGHPIGFQNVELCGYPVPNQVDFLFGYHVEGEEPKDKTCSNLSPITVIHTDNSPNMNLCCLMLVVCLAEVLVEHAGVRGEHLGDILIHLFFSHGLYPFGCFGFT